MINIAFTELTLTCLIRVSCSSRVAFFALLFVTITACWQ
jgi:hypothetical protein